MCNALRLMLFIGLVFGLNRPALAFGLKAHLWIGQQIIEDLRTDCKISVSGKKEAIAPDLCRSIIENQGAFLAGVLGPDAFPDLITGQVTTHPGIQGDWQTSDWLRLLYAEAPVGERLAFAAGYLVHASSDTFAHSYVNAYSGDIFILTDEERSVELRHFVLEKYIDARLPGGIPDVAILKVPAEYARDLLVFNSDAARVSAKSGALHIPAMFAVKTSISHLTSELDKLEEDAGKILADVITEGLELNVKIADGEVALKTAETVLDAHETSLDLQKRARDFAKSKLDDAIDAVDKNDLLILQSEAEAKAARSAIKLAERAANEANSRVSDLQREVEQLNDKLAQIPAKIAKEVCTEVKSKVCDWAPPGVDKLCRWVTDTTCSTVMVANDAYDRVRSEVNRAKAQLNEARDTITRAGIRVAAETAREAVALKGKAEGEAAKATLAATRSVSQAAYDLENTRYEAELQATQSARATVANIKEEIKRFRERVVVLEAIKVEIAKLVAHSNILSAYTKNWDRGLDVAGAEYIKAGLDVGKQLATLQGGILSIYSRWLKCYGGAFTPVPFQVGEYACETEDFYKKVDQEIHNVVIRNLPQPFRRLYGRYVDIRAQIEIKIKGELENAAIALAKLAAPDPTTGEFIEVLTKPENANADMLRAVFAEAGDANGKALLTFSDVTKEIDQDIALTNGKIVTERFFALDYALRLSKLALLDNNGLKRFVWKMGGNPSDVPLPTGVGRYSLLIQSLRSIDGNQQWQPYGIPYARTSGNPQPIEPTDRTYGWGPADAAGGMPLFVNPNLRDAVFRWVFPRPIAGALRFRKELQSPMFTFPSCLANPFPVTFNADGSAALSDLRCTAADGEKAQSPSFGIRLKRLFRGLAGSLGFGPRGTD